MSSNDNTYKLGVAVLLFLFIAVVLIFFLKPIILCAIRWGIYAYMHHKELTNDNSNHDQTPLHNNHPDLSKKMCDELDDHNKETDEDLKKIKELLKDKKVESKYDN